MPEIIGWGSALILLPAFGLQTYRQWRNRHEPANSAAIWFFVLVLAGTGGQVAYSWLVRNWVYLALNSALVVDNGVGLGITLQRWKADDPGGMDRLPLSGKSVRRPGVRRKPGDAHRARPFRAWRTSQHESGRSRRA